MVGAAVVPGAAVVGAAVVEGAAVVVGAVVAAAAEDASAELCGVLGECGAFFRNGCGSYGFLRRRVGIVVGRVRKRLAPGKDKDHQYCQKYQSIRHLSHLIQSFRGLKYNYTEKSHINQYFSF